MIWLLKEKDRGSRVARWAIGAGAAFAVLLVVQIVRSEAKVERQRTAQRAIEKKHAEKVAGIVTAQDETLKVADSLEGQVDELKGKLAAVGSKLRLVQTNHTVSESINTDLRSLLIRRNADLKRIEQEAAGRVKAAIARVERERPECAGLIRPADCPPRELPNFEFSFHVETDEAELETDAGSTFVAGVNAVFEGDCLTDRGGRIVVDANCLKVGAANWRTDVSSVVKATPKAKRKRLGYYLGASYAVWQRASTTQTFDDYSVTTANLGHFGGRAGIDLDLWRGFAFQAGGDVGPDRAEAEFSFSYHRPKAVKVARADSGTD